MPIDDQLGLAKLTNDVGDRQRGNSGRILWSPMAGQCWWPHAMHNEEEGGAKNLDEDKGRLPDSEQQHPKQLHREDEDFEKGVDYEKGTG
jgi:hypothetical protein